MSDADTQRQNDGFRIKLAIIDDNRTDDEGRSWMITSQQAVTNLRLARMNDRDFIEMVIEQMASELIRTLRSDGYINDNE